MKVAVTGHTNGLGLAIFNYFKNNHEVHGFSRSNGFDIRDPLKRKKIIEISKDFDLFFNNAYNNFDNSQLLLLEEMFNIWKDTEKVIVNISTRYTTDLNPYCYTKKQQDIFCENNLYKKPKIINVKPGLIDTSRVNKQQGAKLSTDQVLNIIDFSLNNNLHSVTFGL
jgi:hypothetical protein